MQTRYFVLFVAYDGTGSFRILNEVVRREHPISNLGDIKAIEADLSVLVKGQLVVLLHFIALSDEQERLAVARRSLG